VQEVVLQLPGGSRLIDALRESGLLTGLPDAEVDALQTGIWGRKTPPDQVLRDGDRVELTRALKVDPKVARRERFSQQGARGTGLFSRRRAGAKSGY
jgi:putative ubiquitin-RnfH superfamily antitoxin RatB of RatAB toxin-antitoxin module